MSGLCVKFFSVYRLHFFMFSDIIQHVPLIVRSNGSPKGDR